MYGPYLSIKLPDRNKKPQSYVYYGEFKRGIKHGFGLEIRKDGNCFYEGNWVDGKKTGRGRCFVTTNDVKLEDVFEKEWKGLEYYDG